jgi:Tat protein translocase TatB subunit
MFGLSTWEILIILAVALIFVGPDQLPKVARTIGKGVRQVRGAMGKVDDEMRRAVREASAELDDDGHPVAPPPAAPAAPREIPVERDWSKIGKGEVPGRIAQATPARPTADNPAGPPGDEPPQPPDPTPPS